MSRGKKRDAASAGVSRSVPKRHAATVAEQNLAEMGTTDSDTDDTSSPEISVALNTKPAPVISAPMLDKAYGGKPVQLSHPPPLQPLPPAPKIASAERASSLSAPSPTKAAPAPKSVPPPPPAKAAESTLVTILRAALHSPPPPPPAAPVPGHSQADIANAYREAMAKQWPRAGGRVHVVPSSSSAATSSSTSPQSASGSDDDEKSVAEDWYFFTGCCKSLSKSAIYSLISRLGILSIQTREALKHLFDKTDPAYIVMSLIDPTSTIDKELVFSRLVAHHSVIKDVSCTGNVAECPISKAAYDDAVILNLNGHTYERASISDAIEKTLFADPPTPLLLEDGFTIYPEQLRDLRLYPNLTLGEPSLLWPCAPREPEVVPRFNADELKARGGSFPEFSLWLNSAVDTGQLQAAELYRKRRTDHGSARGANFFASVRVVHTVFPRIQVHWSMTFKNAHFQSCFINCDALLRVDFLGCKFSECSFYASGLVVAGSWRCCDFENCTFYVGTREATRISSNLLEHGCAHVCTRAYTVPPNVLESAHMRSLSVRALRTRVEATIGLGEPIEGVRPQKFDADTEKWVDA